MISVQSEGEDQKVLKIIYRTRLKFISDYVRLLNWTLVFCFRWPLLKSASWIHISLHTHCQIWLDFVAHKLYNSKNFWHSCIRRTLDDEKMKSYFGFSRAEKNVLQQKVAQKLSAKWGCCDAVELAFTQLPVQDFALILALAASRI